jgi:23S rRNA (adenine-N6)-dimethyltransferase
VVAAELVRDAGVRSDDLVVEIGAGEGRLTEPLAGRARRVVAVDLDPIAVEELRRRFDGADRVEVVHGDVRHVGFPTERYRAFGNIPFGVTNEILRRLLDDPSGLLERADLIVQLEAARKRAEPWPSTMLNLSWGPWWELTLARRIPRTAFDPCPSVDAAMLRILRRADPLLDPRRALAYRALVRSGFEQPTWPTARALRGILPPMTWKRLARERGLRVDATPRHLDVWDWVALFRTLDGLGALGSRRAAPRRSRRRSGGTTPTRS